MSMQQLSPNTLLQGGKYQIVSILGQGGFGITYLAIQCALGRKVAIKEFFMKELCERDEATSHVSMGTTGSRETVIRFREKFLKEARSIAALTHPNIVRIIDVFEDNGTAYYVMEYCTGGSLSDIIKQHPSGLKEADALHYIRQVASALQYIHSQKMNHLDVKPANILIDSLGNSILIDFGLSKHYDSEGFETSTTPVGISHGYAPLEQYSGVSEFSPQSDVYSLGATLYKLLTGITPERAGKKQQPLPQQISAATRRAVETAMQVLEENRIQSVSEFLAILDHTAQGEDESTKVADQKTPILDPNPKKEEKEYVGEEKQLYEEVGKEKSGHSSVKVFFSLLTVIALGTAGYFFFSDTPKQSFEYKATYHSDLDSLAYAYGVMFGNQYSNFTDPGVVVPDTNKVMNLDNFLLGFITAIKRDSMNLDLSADEAQQFLQKYQLKLREEMEEKHQTENNEAKVAGADYMAQNAIKDGVIVTESGLQIETIVEGTGARAEDGDKVLVNYKGTLIDGTQFDANDETEFNVNGVIKGFKEGIMAMKEGGKAILTIPSDLAYGDRGAGENIPGGSTLIFEVELLKVIRQ